MDEEGNGNVRRQTTAFLGVPTRTSEVDEVLDMMSRQIRSGERTAAEGHSRMKSEK
jgi:hypothetical protein